MYSLQVKVTETSGNAANDIGNSQYPRKTDRLSTSADAPSGPDSPSDSKTQELIERVTFSAGNPRVEHIIGEVHLYRHIPDSESASPRACLESSQSQLMSGTSSVLPADRSEHLCVLSLPPDMGFPEFCTFLGAYFDRVRELRLVRREGGGASAGASSCLVLVRFADGEAADGFYEDFNGKPVSKY